MRLRVDAVFESHEPADAAIQHLLDDGYPRDDISMVMTEETRVRFFPEDEAKTEEGAAVGGALGALVGGAAALAAASPAVVVAGPLFAALGGVATGLVGGGLVGALVGSGVPDEHARLYATRIEEGGVLVSVEVDEPAEADRAARIFQEVGSITPITRTEVVSA